MRDRVYGREFHGDFSSADASGLSESNSRIALYERGTTTAITLGTTQRVVVTDVVVVAGAALTVTVYDGADATASTGERIVMGNFAANGGVSQALSVAHCCQAGTYPKVKTSGAGQVDVQIHGVISEA